MHPCLLVKQFAVSRVMKGNFVYSIQQIQSERNASHRNRQIMQYSNLVPQLLLDRVQSLLAIAKRVQLLEKHRVFRPQRDQAPDNRDQAESPTGQQAEAMQTAEPLWYEGRRLFSTKRGWLTLLIGGKILEEMLGTEIKGAAQLLELYSPILSSMIGESAHFWVSPQLIPKLIRLYFDR